MENDGRNDSIVEMIQTLAIVILLGFFNNIFLYLCHPELVSGSRVFSF